MTENIDALQDLYSNPESCASLVGLTYVGTTTPGVTRRRHGKGFRYEYGPGDSVTDKQLKDRIHSLVIPPAWHDVWIAQDTKAHILATGIDEKGRKQYMYHNSWRTMRDLIKFYRLILFARALPKIRRQIDHNLRLTRLNEDKVIAIMLWILDNAYIRIGNEAYFQTNESVGLTTLTDRNIVIAGPVVTLAFKGKSGKEQQITFEHPAIARCLDQLRNVPGARLFRYLDAAGDWHPVDAEDINRYLHELTHAKISAKDFRTWGGTLIAFSHLIEATEERGQKPDKTVVQAIDQAAAVLGNTRSVARSSYVHPDILELYGSKHFNRYYEKSAAARKVVGLDRRESELCHFLEQLFEEEFTSLKKMTGPKQKEAKAS